MAVDFEKLATEHFKQDHSPIRGRADFGKDMFNLALDQAVAAEPEVDPDISSLDWSRALDAKEEAIAKLRQP